MKTLSLLGILTILLSCGMNKNVANPNMNKLTVDIEVIQNNMPTTDVGSKNYAIVTFEAGGDTLVENWKLVNFKLMDQDKTELFAVEKDQIEDEFSGKGTIQRKINVRDLPHNFPSSVIVSVTFRSEAKNEFLYESNLITPMVVE